MGCSFVRCNLYCPSPLPPSPPLEFPFFLSRPQLPAGRGAPIGRSVALFKDFLALEFLGDAEGLGLGVAGVGEGFELAGGCCLCGRASDGLGVVEQVYGVDRVPVFGDAAGDALACWRRGRRS